MSGGMSDRDFEHVMSAITGGEGWGFLDEMGGQSKERLEASNKARERNQEHKRAVAQAWAEFLETPGGRLALNDLASSTVDRPQGVYIAGMTLEQTALQTVFQDGQNNVTYTIMQMIDAARQGFGQNSEKETDK